MEIIELSKQLFENKEIRILGTPEEPLFVATDVAKILDIKDISSTLQDYDDTERDQGKVRTSTGMKNVLLVTEPGLYRLLFASHKPTAKQFRRWVCEVLKEIRTKGRYDISEKVIEQNSEYDFDINDFTKKPVVYLIHIIDSDYKFGFTDDISSRFSTHRREFKKQGHDIKLIKCWKYDTTSIAKDVENKIKLYAKQKGMLKNKYGLTEIIEMDTINTLIERIDSYKESDDNACIDRKDEIRLKELELEIIKAQSAVEIIRAQNEPEILRLQLEFYKLKMSNQQPPILKLEAPKDPMKELFDNITEMEKMQMQEVENVANLDEFVEITSTPVAKIAKPDDTKYEYLLKFLRDINDDKIEEVRFNDSDCIKILVSEMRRVYTEWAKRNNQTESEAKFSKDMCELFDMKSKTARVNKVQGKIYEITREMMQGVLGG
jgi:prophage antirepressor-like protein/predicted GIY-YIG superfamily endonuclease